MNKEIISATCILLIILLFQLSGMVSSSAESGINIKRKIIVIDPGHGGNDAGISINSNLYEKTTTLLLARYTAELLKNKYTVALTREGDTGIDLLKRTSFANIQKANIFISLHAKKRGKGSIITYHPPEGTEPADNITWDNEQLSHVKKSRKAAEILAQEFSGELNKDCPVLSAPAVVLKGAQMPAVIIEVLAMEDLMAETDHTKILKQHAEVIAKGIIRILQ